MVCPGEQLSSPELRQRWGEMGPGVSLPSLWTKPQSTSFTFGDTYTEDDVSQPYGSS